VRQQVSYDKTEESPVATSLLLSLLAMLLLVALWTIDCPTSLQCVGIPCDLAIGVTHFAVCPVSQCSRSSFPAGT
jgi:hypothetical protein